MQAKTRAKIRRIVTIAVGLGICLNGATLMAAGPTPYPTNNAAWPGKGVIRKFGWMDDNRKWFWTQREKDQGAVVFAGDSLTGGWKDLAKDFSGLKVANRGVGGDTSRGLLFRFQEDVLDLKPKAIVILIGLNDLTAMGKPEDAAANIAAMLAQTEKQDPAQPVILCTIPPSANPKAPVKEADRLALNARIKALAAGKPHVGLCDVYAAAANTDGTPRGELFVEDKLHFSTAGHQRVAEALKPIHEKLSPGLHLQRQALEPAADTSRSGK